MRKFLATLVRPHGSLTDVGERWRVQLSMTFSLIIAVGMLGPVLFGKHDGPERDFLFLGLILVCCISFWLGHTRSYKWGPILLVFGIVGMGFALVLMGSANNPSIALNTTFPLALVIGSAVLSLRGLLLLTLITGIGPMFLPLFMNDKVTLASGMLRDGGVFLVLGLLLISITVLRNRFEKSRLDELRSVNQALQVIQATLEERVNERTSLADRARADAEIARRTAVAQVWFMQGQAQLAEKMRGEQSTEMLANNIISHLCQYVGAQTGALFLISGEKLKLTGRYAYVEHLAQRDEFGLGDNLVGEAARENRIIHLTGVGDAPLVGSALGNTRPKQLLIVPVQVDAKVFGVLELATLHAFSTDHVAFLSRNIENIAIAFQTAHTRDRIASLLLESQRQAEELQTQEEELRSANEELRAQAENVKTGFKL